MATSSNTDQLSTAGGWKAIKYVISCAQQVGAFNLAATVKSKNTCKACAFGTGGQRGGLHNEFSKRVEICNKNIQAHLSDIRPPIPLEIFQHNSVRELQALSGKQLEDLGRLDTPLYKAPGQDYFQPLHYDQAIARIAERMRGSDPQRTFFYASGRSSNEAAFLLQLFARVFGSNHINNCSYYCHQASGVGLQAAIGTGTATIQYGDLHQADLIFVCGANPASNHPRFVKVLIECRQRGGKVIVINPAQEAGLLRFASPSNFRSMIAGGSEVASLYVQPHIGGDVALLSGVAKHLLEMQAIDALFIAASCNGFAEYCAFIESLDWPQLQDKSGVSREQMRKIAELYAASNKTVFSWGMGLTHHRFGTENVECISNLALLRGMLGAPGKGLLPLRGHSNVQGVGSMGFTPALKKQVFNSIEQKLGVKLPVREGMDTLSCLQAAQRGEIDFALLLGGNLFAASPDAAFTEQAMSAIPCKVMLNTTLNQSHVNGVAQEVFVLPVRVRDEETQSTTQESMFNFLRMSDGGFNRIAGLRSEVEIIAELAAQVISNAQTDFRQFHQHSSIRKTIAALIPGFEAMAAIDDSKEEFHISGRYLESAVFPTADGKANFRLPCPESLQILSTQPDSFQLTTVRSEGQFNTIIFDNADVYRRQSHRHVLLMNEADMQSRQLSEGDKVDIYNATGVMAGLELRQFAIREGNLMTYFPEANVLVPQCADTRSRTPAFKSVAVKLRKSALPC